MSTLRRAGAVLAVALFAVLAVAGCNSSSSTGASSSARAAASAAAANPTVSADISQLESELLAAYQQHFTPLHPVKSMEAAIHQVFPSGDASKIATYAVQQLNPEMAKTTMDGGAARQAWAAKVVKDALGSDPNATASPGSAVIPGASAPAPAPSSAKSS